MKTKTKSQGAYRLIYSVKNLSLISSKMEKLALRPCVQVRRVVRQVQRHPVTQRTVRSGHLLKKHVVRGATLSLVPDALNDFGFHHAQVSLDEAIHIVIDQATISTISAMIAITLLALRESE